MGEVAEALRQHHRELLARLGDGLKELAERRDPAHEVLGSLGEDFVRYVRAGEGSLYPTIAPLVRSDEQVMAPMMLDVRAIGGYVAEVELLALDALTAPKEEARSLWQRIERLAAQFEAVIRLHLEKLEQIYLPLLEDAPVEQQHEVLEAMALEDSSLARSQGSGGPGGAAPGTGTLA